MDEETGTTSDFEPIFEHCAAITSHIELSDVVKATLAAISDLLPCDQAVITRVEEDLVKVVSAEPPVMLEAMESGLSVGRGLVGLAIAERTPVYSPDIRHDARVDRSRIKSETKDRSVVAVPVAVGNEVIGAIHAISFEADAFSEQDRARLVAIAPAVGVAMHNAMVFDRERESWEHRRRLDVQKSVFMRLAAMGLDEPLSDIAVLVGRLKVESSKGAQGLATELLDQAQRFADLVEEVLRISLRDSSEMVLTD